MNVEKLTYQWIDYLNRHYIPYLTEAREPRYQMKQFFLYSYKLLARLGDEWKDYLQDYSQLFLCDPSDDWYSKRHVIGKSISQIRLNVLEWANTFEIIGMVGYPLNKSAKEDLLKYAKINLGLIKKNPEGIFYDLMLSSLISNIKDSRNDYSQFLREIIVKNIKKSDCSIHSLVAYLNALTHIENNEDLVKDIIKKIFDWIDNPEGHSRINILIVSRLVTRMDMDIFKDKKEEILPKLRKLFFECLREIHQLDWVNTPINLEAAYILSNDEEKKIINGTILREISPSKLVKLKELFKFLTDERFPELDTEVEKIREKCMPNPTKKICLGCMDKQVATCWMRILAKLLDVPPGFHGPFEVADTVVYTLNKGIYFVIKADKISGQRDGGDTLYRQTTSLFNQPNSLVFYLNPNHTEPSVIENIKKAESSSINNPKFIVIDKKYTNQIYKRYKETYESK